MSPQVKQRIKLGIVAVSIIVLAIIFFQNTQQVTLKILFATFSMPLVAWLLFIAIIGFGMGYATASILRRRKMVEKEKPVE